MRKFIFLIAVLVLVPRAHATTYTAATCNAADVNAKISLTVTGDTVLVPSGSCSWSYNAPVTIPGSKAITLNGQGVATITWTETNTNPNSSTTGAFIINGSAAGNTRVTGFTFNGAYLNGDCPIQANSTYGSTLTYRFDHNTLNTGSLSNNGTQICVWGTGPALFDHNTFNITVPCSDAFQLFAAGSGLVAPQSVWGEDVVPGGPNMVFIEDNAFNGPIYTAQSTCTGPEQAFGGSMTVLRHNTITNAALDFHGQNFGQNFSCTAVNSRWWEVYDNQFIVTGNTNIYQIMTFRGGSGVVWGNTESGTFAGSAIISFQQDCPTSSGVPYPYQDQTGQGIVRSGVQHASPAYLWNNTGGGAFSISSTSSYVQGGRDYFASTNQPATLQRCESAADVATGCPIVYSYTPYTYPHPLVSGGTTTLSAPAISPAGGVFNSPVSVTIAAPSGSNWPAGVTICATQNGATPTATTAGTCDSVSGEFAYGGAFNQNIPSPGGSQVKAIATSSSSGFTNSAVSTASYVLQTCSNTSLGSGWTCLGYAEGTTSTTSIVIGTPLTTYIAVFEKNTGSTCSVTDTLGNSYSQITSAQVSAGLYGCSSDAQATVAGQDTINCDSTATSCAAIAISVPGNMGVTVDKICTNANATSGAGSNNTSCSAGFTNTGSNELILASSNGGNASALAAGTNFSLVDSGTTGLRAEYYMQATATAINPTETIDASQPYAFQAFSLEPTGSSGSVTISSISSTNGPPGTYLTINGTGFAATKGASTVAFGSNTLTPCYSWSATALICTVPYMVPGPYNVVVTVGGVASNPLLFNVLAPPVTAPGGVF